MSLLKIGNLVNTFSAGEDIVGVLKSFGDLDTAGKLLGKYIDTDDASKIQLLRNAFDGIDEEAAAAALGITNVGTAAANAGNIATGMGASFKNAFKGLASVLGISAKALGAGLGAAAGLALIAGIVNTVKKHQDQLVIDAHDAYEKYDTKTSAVDEQIEKVKELRAELEAGNLTSEQEYAIRSQILDIQNSIVNTYGSQVDGINLVNGALEDELALINEISSAEARKTYYENQNGFDTAIKKMSETNKYTLGAFNPNVDRQEFKNVVSDIFAIVSEYADHGVSIQKNQDGWDEIVIENVNVAEANELANEINDKVQALYEEDTAASIERYGEDKNLNFAFRTIDNFAKDILTNTQPVIDKYQKTAFEGLSLIIQETEHRKAKAALEEYTVAIANYNDAMLKADMSNKDSLDNLNNAKLAYDEAKKGIEKFADGQFGVLFDEIGKDFNKGMADAFAFKTALEYGAQEGADAAEKAAHDALTNLKSKELSSDDFIEILGLNQKDLIGSKNPLLDVVNDVVDSALDLNVIKDENFDSIKYLVDILSSIGAIVSKEVEPIPEKLFADLFKQESFNETVDNFQKNIDNINSAFNSIRSGELTGSALTDLLQQFPELNNYIKDSNNYINDLNAGLTNLSAEKTRTAIKTIKEELSEITDPAQKAQAENYMQLLVDQVDFSSSNVQGLKQVIYDNIFDIEEGSSITVSSYRQQVYNELMKEFEGNPLALKAIARITLQPNVVWNTKDIKSLIPGEIEKEQYYNNVDKIQRSQNAVARHNAEVSMIEAERALSIAKGRKELAASDYNSDIANNLTEIDELTTQIKSLQYNVENPIDGISLEEQLENERKLLELQTQRTELEKENVELANERDYLPVQNILKDYDALSKDMKNLENIISDKELEGLKIVAEDYINMVSKSEEQIKNLDDQNKELEKLIKSEEISVEKAEEYQKQIDENKDTIRDLEKSQYEWNKAIRNIPLTEMETLSSALSSVFSELQSETGVTIDTIEALATQFSDMANIDIQDALYRTADGLKLDTDMLQEFTEAQYEATMSDFESAIAAQRKEIEDYQKIIGNTGTNSKLQAMQDNLEGLLNRQAQYFAAYKEQMDQFSKYNAIQIAKNTENAGNRYVSMFSEFETAVEAYNKGLVGTDDFKTVAEYFSPNGFNDADNFAENYNKIARYMTDNEKGVKHFLNDLVSKGYATYDEALSQYTYDIPNMRKAAMDMGMGEEWFKDMFGRLEDYDSANLFVGSMAEGALKTEELSHELSNAKIRLAELQAQGADQGIIDAQQEVVNQLTAEQELLQQSIQNFQTESAKEYIEGIKTGKTYIETLKGYMDEALGKNDESTAQRYLDEIQRYADEYGLTVDIHGNLDLEAYDDLLNDIAIGSWEKPLSAEDLGYKEGTESAKAFLDTQKQILKVYGNNREELSQLSKFTAEELQTLVEGLDDGKYNGGTETLHQAEDLLESIQEEAGLTDEQLKTLVDTLVSLGVIDNPEWKAEVDTTELEDAERRAQYLQGSSVTYNMDVSQDGMANAQSYINSLTQGVSTAINVEIHGDEEADNLTELLADVPPETPCVVNCTVENQEQLDTLTAQVAKYNEEKGTNITLNATLAGSNETAKNDIDSIIDHAEKQNPKIKVNANTSPAISDVSFAIHDINKKTAEITIRANTARLMSDVALALHDINKKEATVTVYKKEAEADGTLLYTGTMTSVASHANGTVPYNVLNTTPAYANGKVSLPKNETALINELGQESVIRNGEWHLLPPGMHFENLKKGDIILNHLQTKSLIEQGKALGKGHVRGYANGTLLSSAYYSGTGGVKLQGGLSGNKLGGSSSSPSSNSTKYQQQASNAVAKAAESVEDLVDWIEVLLSRLQSKTDSFIQKAENAIKLSTSLNNYQKAIENISEQIAANEAGAIRYQKQANAVGLSSDLKKKVENGTIDINEYSEEDRKKIDEYKQWFEKSQECLQNIADLQQQMIEVAQSKLDAIIDKYNLRVEYQDAYLDRYDAQLNYRETAGYSDTSGKQKEIYNSSIEKEMNKISYYEQAAAALYNEMNAQLASGLMTKGDDRWRETQNQLQEYNSSLYESKTSIEEWNQALRAINTNKLQDALDRFTRWANQLASIIGLSEARDENISESTYKKQITANNNQIYYQDKLLAEYLAEQAKYEYGSEKWNEYADKIADCKNETLSLLETNEKLKDSIVEERWETFNLLQDKVDNSITEIDYLRDALNSSVNSAGELTSDGYANIALIGKAITLENQTIADYTEALKKLDKEYANGNISQKEYNEKQEEFLGVIRDSASSVQDYKDELLDLYKEQIEAQNEVLTDNIDMYKQAYESQKDYFEYGETLKEQTKTVDTLEAQIQALNGVTNAAGKARLAQLKAQQAEAKEALDKTKREHEYELKISGFDGLKENVQSQLEAVQNELEINSEMQQKVVDTMLLNIQNNYSSAYSTIQSTISSTGVVMSNMTNNAINEWTKLSKVMKLTAKAMSEVADYDPSKTATSIKTSQIVTNKTSMTDSKGNTVTTDQAEANAIRNDNGKTNAANLGNSYSTALVKATSLSLNKSSLSLTVGKSSTLTVKLAPENAASNLTWKTSSSKIATVSNGKVTAVKKGSATITVTDSYSGKSAKCKVTVKDKTSSSSTNNSTKNIWSGISTDTSEKGNSNLDRNVSIIDRMKYFGYASDSTARKQLFKNLGGSGSYTGSATQNAWMLEQLKKAGYSSGGIVGYSSVNVGDILQKAMISTGDNGLAFLTAGETVMPTKFTELLPQGLKILEEVAKVNAPSVNSIKQPIVVNTELNFQIDQITNDIDLNAFANQMKKEIPKYITSEIRRLR